MEEIRTFEAFKLNRLIPIKVKIEAINFAKNNENQKADSKYGFQLKL